jgi:ribosomal protein S18 acetylase RimI-like enzyme
MNFAIRAATKEDAVLIADISRQTFYETFAADNTKADMDKFLNEQFTSTRLISEVSLQENYFFLAYDNNEVAGYLKLRENKQSKLLTEKPSIEIARIYSIKKMIGKGIGKLLMQKSIDIAKQKQKQIIWLGVWEKNQRAIDFYHKWGFEKFGEQDFLLGTDLQTDLLMKKEL